MKRRPDGDDALIKYLGQRETALEKQIVETQKASKIVMQQGKRKFSGQQTLKRGEAVIKGSNERDNRTIRERVQTENGRLRTSIQALRWQVSQGKGNEAKIAQVLRQSKQKLMEYRQKLKIKSKRVEQLTQANGLLKNTINKLQQKNIHLTSYSEWQEGQLRNAKEQLAISKQESLRAEELALKIQRMEATLRDYQMQFERIDQRRPSVQSIPLTIPLSNQTLSEHQNQSRWNRQHQTPESFGELEEEELAGLKHRQVTYQEIEALQEVNSTLRSRVLEMEGETQHLRIALQQREERLVSAQQIWKIEQERLRSETEGLSRKLLQSIATLRQKEEMIIQMELQLQGLRKGHEQDLQISENYVRGLQRQVQKLKFRLNELQQQIHESKQLKNELQQNYKKQLSIQRQNYIDNQDKLNRDIQFLSQKNDSQLYAYKNMEKQKQQIYHKLCQLEIQCAQLEEKLQAALDEQQALRKLIGNLQFQIEQIKETNNGEELQNYKQKLKQAQTYIAKLQQEKQSDWQEMDRSAKEIQKLRLSMSEMSRMQSNSPIPEAPLDSDSESGREIRDEQTLKNPKVNISSSSGSEVSIINGKNIAHRNQSSSKSDQHISLKENLLEDLKEELIRKQKLLVGKQREIQDLKSRIVDLNSKSEVEENKLELELIDSRYSLEREKEERVQSQLLTQEIIAKYKEQIQSLKKQILAYQNQWNEKNSEIQELTNKKKEEQEAFLAFQRLKNGEIQGYIRSLGQLQQRQQEFRNERDKLSQKVDQFNYKIKELNERNENLIDSNKKYLERLEILEQTHNLVKNEQVTLKSIQQTLQDQLTHSFREKDGISLLRLKAEADACKLGQQLAEIKEEVKLSQQEAANNLKQKQQLRVQIEKIQHVLVEKEEEIKILQTRIQQKNEDIKIKFEEIQNLKQNRKQSNLKINQLQKELIKASDASIQIQSLRNRISQLLQTARAKSESLGLQILQKTKQCQKWRIQTQRYCQKLLQAEDRLRQLSEKLNQNSQILQNLREHNKQETTKSQKTISFLTQQIVEGKKQMLLVSSQLQDALRKVSQIQREISLVNSAKQKLQNLIYSKEQQLALIKDQNASLRHEAGSLGEQNSSLRKDAILLQEQCTGLKLNGEGNTKQLQQRVIYLQQKLAQADKQAARRIQILAIEQRQQIQDLQKKYLQQLQGASEDILEITRQRQSLKDQVQTLKYDLEETGEELQNLRNELTLKISNIEECREIVERLQEQNEELRRASSGGGDSNGQKLLDAMKYIDHLIQTNHQLKLKEQVIQNQLRVKQYQGLRLKAPSEQGSRFRAPSEDSRMTKSKIFNDQKSQNTYAELQDCKLKLQSAEAYIIQLQEQCMKLSQVHSGPQDLSQKKQIELQNQYEEIKMVNKGLEKQIEEIKMKVEYLQAYIDQLQSFNPKSDGRSRLGDELVRSGKSTRSVRSMRQGVRDKVQLMIQFVEGYSVGNSCLEREEELKSHFGEVWLQLLTTISCRLQKQIRSCREKQLTISELRDQNHHLQQQFVNYQQNCTYLQLLQKKLAETESMLQDSYMQRMKLQQKLAATQLQMGKLQLQGEEIKGNYPETSLERTGSKRQTLQILEEQNQQQSDSVMSESADSEIPSSVSQQRDFKASIDFTSLKRRLGNPGNAVSQDIGKRGPNQLHLVFLYGCLQQVKQIQANVQTIQQQIKNKKDQMGQLVGSKAARRLEELQSNLKLNEGQLRRHFENWEKEMKGLIQEIFQMKEDGGNGEESRVKIQKYLHLLEQQILKNSRLYNEQAGKINKGDSPKKDSKGLQQIKEDVVNEEKGSSIITGRQPVVLSLSNSEGVTDFLDAVQMRNHQDQLIRELHILHDELHAKEDLRNQMTHRFSKTCDYILNSINHILKNCSQLDLQPNKEAIIEQLDHIQKKLLQQLDWSRQSLENCSPSSEVRKSPEGQILLESNKKNQKQEEGIEEQYQKTNLFLELLGKSQEEVQYLTRKIPNDSLRMIIGLLQRVLDRRYHECLEYLDLQSDQLLSLLRGASGQARLEEAAKNLAVRYTRQDMVSMFLHQGEAQTNALLRAALESASGGQSEASLASQDMQFDPQPGKMLTIKEQVYSWPTELSRRMHNLLVQLVTTGNPDAFYMLVRQFYTQLHDWEANMREKMSATNSLSLQNSIKMKEILEQNFDRMDINSLEKFQRLQQVNTKNRSSSCSENPPPIEPRMKTKTSGSDSRSKVSPTASLRATLKFQ